MSGDSSFRFCVRSGYLAVFRALRLEVQDFSLGQLFLLCRITSNLMCTGDAAQCIVPGICFRFKDLKAELHSQAPRPTPF